MKKPQPDPVPTEQPVPVDTKVRIPVEEALLGASDTTWKQMQEALKPSIGGAALHLSEDTWRGMKQAVNAPMKGVMEELAKSSARLARIRMSDLEGLAGTRETFRMPTPPEVVISETLREEVGNLAEITAAMNTHMTAIVAIASELGPLKDYADKAEKSSRSLNWLTAALVGLTAVLAIPVIAEFLRALTTTSP